MLFRAGFPGAQTPKGAASLPAPESFMTTFSGQLMQTYTSPNTMKTGV